MTLGEGARASFRGAGLLLHPTSLPGTFPIGDLGPAAHDLLDWLVSAGLSRWQTLPLGPTGFGDSPYGALSSFAGNPLLISPQALVADGLLPPEGLPATAAAAGSRVDFAAAGVLKEALHRDAWRAFETRRPEALIDAWGAFVADPEVEAWLEDWSLFAALKSRHAGRSWLEWDPPLRDRVPEALTRVRDELSEEIAFRRFEQFLFCRQWWTLRRAAEARGIELIGDLPIYPALDSADVWANRERFDLDEQGRPRKVAGVPPDYFSATGQLWGNPLYRWRIMATERFSWWTARVRWQLRLVHRVRLDHFRGFVSYWEVPGDAEFAVAGRWRRGPGRRLFAELHRALGQLPLVAEDLGEIDERVHTLRRELGLPGMRVLQFAFDEVDSLHAPHRHLPDCVVYTGTHDNDTARGWIESVSEDSRRRALVYLGTDPLHFPDALVGAALASPGELAILPLQDLLGLGSDARMNRPGAGRGNWSWRVDPGSIPPDLPERLRERIAATARLPPAPAETDAVESSG